MFTQLFVFCIKKLSYCGVNRSGLFQEISYFSKSLYPTFYSFKEAKKYLSKHKVKRFSNDLIELSKDEALGKSINVKCPSENKFQIPVKYKYPKIKLSNENSPLKSSKIKNKSNPSFVNFENETQTRKEESVKNIQEIQPLKSKKKSTKAENNADDLIKSMNLLYDQTEKDRICVYTDGCCKNLTYAGIGVYWGSNCPCRNVGEKFVGIQTNNRAEIAAAAKAVEIAYNHGIKKILIHTDSQFTINCMTKWVPGWKNNNWIITSSKKEVKCRDVLEKLDKLIIESNIDVKWKYVRAHMDDECNNFADALAKQGADDWKASK